MKKVKTNCENPIKATLYRPTFKNEILGKICSLILRTSNTDALGWWLVSTNTEHYLVPLLCLTVSPADEVLRGGTVGSTAHLNLVLRCVRVETLQDVC